MITLVKRKIAVKPILDPDKIGSLYVPDVAKERSDQGIVKYVGPNVKDVKIGDHILFSGYTGTTVQFENDGDGVLIIFDERFTVCILNGPDTNVNGLYFRGVVDAEDDAEMDFKIEIVLAGFKAGNFTLEDCKKVIRQEHAKREANRYFSATYEMAMNLIAESFRNTEFAKGIGFKNPLAARPALEDYEELEDE